MSKQWIAQDCWKWTEEGDTSASRSSSTHSLSLTTRRSSSASAWSMRWSSECSAAAARDASRSAMAAASASVLTCLVSMSRSAAKVAAMTRISTALRYIESRNQPKQGASTLYEDDHLRLQTLSWDTSSSFPCPNLTKAAVRLGARQVGGERRARLSTHGAMEGMLNYFVPEDGDSSDHLNVVPLPRVDQLRLQHVKKVRSAFGSLGQASTPTRLLLLLLLHVVLPPAWRLPFPLQDGVRGHVR